MTAAVISTRRKKVQSLTTFPCAHKSNGARVSALMLKPHPGATARA